MSTAWISQSLMDVFIFALFITAIVILIPIFWSRSKPIRSDQSVPAKTISTQFIFASFGGYFIVAVLGAVFNADSDYETTGNLSKFVWMLQFVLFYWTALQIDWTRLMSDRLKTIFQFFAWTSLVPVLYGFNIYLFEGVDIVTLQKTSYRIIGLLNSATYHGLVGGLIFCFLLPIFLLNIRRLTWNTIVLSLICLSLIIASTTLTMTRGVWLSLFISGIVLVYFLNFKKLLLATLVIAGVGVAYFQTPIRSMIHTRSNSDSCRIKLIQTHWTIFKSHPLLGIGYRDNLRSIKEYWPESEVATCRHLRDNGNHAHNQYMNVLATTGILGFLFFIAFYGYFIILNLQLLKIYRNDKLHYPLCVSLLMMQIFFLVSNMTETSFEYGKVRTVLLIVWAVVLALFTNREVRTTTAAQPA